MLLMSYPDCPVPGLGYPSSFCNNWLLMLTPVPISRDLPLADDQPSLKAGSYEPHSQEQAIVND